MDEIANTAWITSFTNNTFELILLVTEECNFRCIYCYEDFKIGKMPTFVIEGVKNLINKRIAEIETLNLSFFGGEPLLNKSAILDISNFASQICKLNNVIYSGSITTNGYSLNENTFEKLLQCEVRNFQITLDGEKATHDKLRPTLNGKATFNKIYSNLLIMANSSHDFRCTLRFNIADSNFSSVESFIDNYSSPFVNDPRFTFHFHPIFGMPELKLTEEIQLVSLKNLAAKGWLKNDADSEKNVCYAAKANSFVIRADGRVQKCTVALGSEINNIGKISNDGSLNIDQEKFKKWIFAENKQCPVQSLTLEKLVVPYENAGKHIAAK